MGMKYIEIEDGKEIKSSPTIKYKVAFLFGMLFLFVAGYATVSGNTRSSSSLATQVTTALSFKTYNSYTETTPVYSGYPWDVLVEPYSLTTLAVISPITTSTYTWHISNDEISELLEGELVTFTFTGTGYFEITLKETKISGESTSVIKNAMSKYVRREIRLLSDSDRDEFFSAMEILSKISTTDGVETYGAKYIDKDYFNKLHGGIYPECNMIHGGASFLPAHVAFSLMFEQSLQATNPKISMPFWDFTYDDKMLSSDWRTSSVFADDWLGTADPDNDDYVIDSGRWAYWPVMTNAWEFSTMHNSFGYLTEPWNNNPTPYLTRAASLYGLDNTQTMPSCADHYECFLSSSWMEFTTCIEGDAHEDVHQLLGGVFGTKIPLTEYTSVHPQLTDTFLGIAGDADQIIQTFITAGWLECPTSCSAETSYEDCSCSCPVFSEGISDSYKNKLLMTGIGDFYEYFDKTGGLKITVDEDGVVQTNVKDLSTETQEVMFSQLVEFYCDPGMIGDMYGSMSTNDPSFWPLHPTLDRLWQWTRLRPTPKFDDTWFSESGNSYCYGHNADDVMLFANLLGEGNNDYYYTNADLYAMFDPTNDALPYIYENFDWKHCEEDFKTPY